MVGSILLTTELEDDIQNVLMYHSTLTVHACFQYQENWAVTRFILQR